MEKLKEWVQRKSDKLIQLAIIIALLAVVGLVVFYSNEYCIPCELGKIGGK